MAAALVASATSASTADKPAAAQTGGGVAHGKLYAAALLVSIAVFVGVTASTSDKADRD